MSENDSTYLTFIQYDIPALKAGEYTITATQTVNTVEPNLFAATKKFAVPGNRFQLNGDDVVSVFPAALSNGEYTGVMPLAVLKRETLPWQRTSVQSDPSAPWLALLLFEGPEPPAVTSTTAADLFPAGTTITVEGSSVTGIGTMPENYVSSATTGAGMNPLDYGQTPSDSCSVIDLAVDEFSRACPSAADLPFLAHIRKSDTYDATDSSDLIQQFAIVLGCRWPKPDTQVYAYLVSLENLGDILPSEEGTPSPNLPSDTLIRLVCLHTWSYFANDLGQMFVPLCEALNSDSTGAGKLTNLRLPASTPTQEEVDTALAHQAAGTLTDADATVLVNNALCMGYTALNHELREAGHTVSWCRGPLVPYAIEPFQYTIATCPDALLRYDPQTGMFDASYAQAWQLGQLLALQSTSFSVSLYTWKQTLQKTAAAQEEMTLIMQKMTSKSAFYSVFSRRSMAMAEPPPVPQDIADWIANLKLLKGVPFAALVPDEAMLPVESLRFFYVDQDWTAALVDGAFSIGRAGMTGLTKDTAPLTQAHRTARSSARRKRKNLRPTLAAQQQAAGDSEFEVITGCLLRSQLVSGWPGLNVNGYADTEAKQELPKLRMERLSGDVLICLFEGDVKFMTISEPAEQLHCGVEGDAETGFTTDLRDIAGSDPGQQYLVDGVPVTVAVSVRSDQQTLMASATAEAIKAKLNLEFNQGLTTFTSAEFALEMVKGVEKVEYQVQ